MTAHTIDKVTGAIRRTALSAAAGVVAAVGIAFFTAGGYMHLAADYGSANAALLIGGVYFTVAALIFLMRPGTETPAQEPDKVTLGLALGASFAEGFSAGRHLRR